MKKDIIIECNCQHELVKLEYEKEDDLLFMSIFSFGTGDRLGFLDKLRYIGRILKYGTPYTDSIVLDRKSRDNFKKFLEDIE